MMIRWLKIVYDFWGWIMIYPSMDSKLCFDHQNGCLKMGSKNRPFKRGTWWFSDKPRWLIVNGALFKNLTPTRVNFGPTCWNSWLLSSWIGMKSVGKWVWGFGQLSCVFLGQPPYSNSRSQNWLTGKRKTENATYSWGMLRLKIRKDPGFW